MTSPEPAYLALSRSGELARRAKSAREMLSSCPLCPRDCRANRLWGERKVCGVGAAPWISSAGPHFGEERPLVGKGGSGTIFMAGCNLLCLFCQNYDASHRRDGGETTPAQFAELMLRLQEIGCHNINFVTPTHQVPQILEALVIAAGRGLKIPLVYNTGGYDRVETLRLLDGVIDIYMPDFKFGDRKAAKELAGAPDYPEKARAAIREMHRQVGDLVIDANGLAMRGLIVRHLVLPGGRAGTEAVMRFIAEEISRNTYVNLMDQYHPAGRAHKVPGMDRRLTKAEFEEALAAARAAGLHRFA